MITRGKFLSFSLAGLTLAAVGLLAPLAPAQAQGVAGKWQQGRHYRALTPAVRTNVAPGKVEVVEVFWYGCGACFMLDPYLESWKKNGKPANVEFVRVPVAWNKGAEMHARLYYTLRELKQDERLHTKVFDTIHRGGNGLLGSDEASTLRIMTAWAKQNGIAEKAFVDAWKSMSVVKNVREADLLVRRYRAEFTPYMVIAGKYTTDITMAGGVPQMLSLINELAAAEKPR